jgi:hypothetical protein
MDTHVKVLGVLLILLGVLGLLVGILVFAIMGGAAGVIRASGDPDAMIAVPIVGAIGGILLVLLAVLSLPSVIAGIGLLNFRPWARILGIVVCIMNLVNFPFGTIIGLYGLFVLLSSDTERLFAPGERIPM